MPLFDRGKRTARPAFCALLCILFLSVTFSVAAHALSMEKVEAFVDGEVAARSPQFSGARLEILFSDPDGIKEAFAAFGENVKLRLGLPAGARIFGKALLPVDIYEGMRFIKRVNIKAQVRAYKEVVCTIKKVVKGEKISEANVTRAEKEVTVLPPTAVVSLDRAFGKESVSFLPPGTVIMDWMLKKTPAVRKGDRITAVVYSEEMTVSAAVIALEDGAAGGHIRVRNRDSGKILDAVVINSREVRLE